MPTLLLLDVSLSMSRPVPCSDSTENQTRFTFAIASINSFLDYLSVHCKLEYVGLVAFSSVYEIAVPFTREYETIRNKLPTLEEGDKTCIDTAILGANQIILNEWGCQTPVQIIIITDGSCGVGTLGRNRISDNLPLPSTYPAKIHILPIASLHDPLLQHAMPLYQKIVDLASTPVFTSLGAVYCPDQLNLPGVLAAMNRLCEQQYQEYWCTLKCGQLDAKVQLYPPPHPASYEGIPETHTISNQIQIIGFISQQDLGTPIAMSKHLIIPQPQAGPNSNNREAFGSKTPTKEGSNEGSANEEDMSDPSKVPNFCVLLHGALKVEGMAAIVQLGPEWWGAVSAWCEAARARRSCLLLSVMARGGSAAPWLGALDQLGPSGETATESFPVRSWRSYSAGGAGGGGGAGGAAWARPHALLADVQKVLRHARKLPDKTQHLYKELNRLRRAAISLGFTELLSVVGAALERECAALPPTAAPECALQLAHAAAALTDPATAADAKHTLLPAASFTHTPMSH